MPVGSARLLIEYLPDQASHVYQVIAVDDAGRQAATADFTLEATG